MQKEDPILDNPIFFALSTGNKNFSYGTDDVKYIQRDIGLFAGMRNNSEEELLQLHSMIDSKNAVILFTPHAIKVPSEWKVRLEKDLLQMVYAHETVAFEKNERIQSLHDEHIAAMLELTALTKPGPFLNRTIDFGNYEGIFDAEKLIAMAGQRLQPDPYTEVSAVCTHPDHTGKGYAAELVKSQVAAILNEGRIPFLHAYPENLAVRVYERTGFIKRKLMVVYLLEA